MSPPSWYFRDVTRNQADNILQNHCPGTFLVRKSSDGITYYIHVRTETKIVYYAVLRSSDLRLYYLNSNFVYDSLTKLIEALRNDHNNQQGLKYRLLFSCPKEQPKKQNHEDILWLIPTQHIRLNPHPIGRGSFGQVFKGVYNGTKVAVKQILRGGIKDFEKEVMALVKLHHHYVVQMFGICKGVHEMLIVLEYMHNGNVCSYLQKYDLPKEDLIKIAYRVSKGMEYIHSKSIVHRDLACRNILLDKNLVAKVSDFGLSRYKNRNGTFRGTLTGTDVRSDAIEIFESKEYTEYSDVWAFGMVLYELFMKACHPFNGWEINEIYNFLKNRQRPGKPLTMPDEIYSVALSCWRTDPNNRPTFEELVKHFS